MLHNDDLKTLQEEVFKALEGQYKGLGGFIMSGCSVEDDDKEPTKHKITEGMVFLNGKFLEVDEAINLAEFPKYIVEDIPEMRTSYPLASGGIAPKRELYKAKIVSEDQLEDNLSEEEGRTEWIKVTLEGGTTYFNAVRGAFDALSIGHATDVYNGHATLDVLGNIKVSGTAEFGNNVKVGSNLWFNNDGAKNFIIHQSGSAQNFLHIAPSQEKGSNTADWAKGLKVHSTGLLEAMNDFKVSGFGDFGGEVRTYKLVIDR
ncbi:hypothetical protein E1171_00555, partial [Cytophagales bacterium RKSG123]|nr:hypothetical protein [Xanthovirga aplysinae]